MGCFANHLLLGGNRTGSVVAGVCADVEEGTFGVDVGRGLISIGIEEVV